MRLYLLQLGVLPGTGTPFPGYLIQTDDGTNVLVDTGWPRSLIGAYRAPASPVPDSSSMDAPEQFTLDVARRAQIDDEDFVINRLAALGLAPQAIHYLVCTHFDLDHAGNNDLFPEAQHVVQRRHYAVAHQHTRFKLMGTPWDRPNLHYRFIDGDTELLPGIELLATDGHVLGHQSVLVRLPETGPVLLAIDAISLRAHLAATAPERLVDMDHDAQRASVTKLMTIAKREDTKLLVFGHDTEQWRTLKKSPEFYT